MTPPKDHSAMQKSVCSVCFRKPKNLINISAKVHISIQEYILPTFGTADWAWLPSVICSGCYHELYAVKTNPKHTVKHVDYDSLVPPVGHGIVGYPVTRQQQVQAMQPCLCSVCSIGRMFGQPYFNYKNSVTEPPGRPRVSSPDKVPEPVTLCKLCLSSWGPGQQHVCTRKVKRNNMEELVRNTSRKSKERIVSSQLKEVFEDHGITTKGGTVSLITGGTGLLATLGLQIKKPCPRFSNVSLTKLQIKMGSSDKKMKIMANYLRVTCGKKSVHKLEDYMTERNKKLEEYFVFENIVQTEKVSTEDDENKENKKKKETRMVDIPVVYATDVEKLALFIMEERSLQPDNTLLQVGIDDGQGLLKVMLSVKENCSLEEVRNKRVKYSDGFASKDFKYSGVKKLILLLVSPTTERHDNMAALLGKLGIAAIEFGFCCDLKMVLILLGKQSASSKFCCPFCTGCSPWQGDYSRTTIGSLWEDYNSFVSNGSNTKHAMKYHNVVNPPLVTGGDAQKVLGDFFLSQSFTFTRALLESW